MLINLIYHSIAVDHITEQDITDILEEARAFNLEHNITGLLLFHQGEFIQILEGEDEDVKGIYAKIKEDPRHRLVRLLETSPIPNRSFPDWQMAFKPLTDTNLTDLSQHLDLGEFHRLSRVHQDTSLANKLLKVIGDMLLGNGPEL
jgi:hypothetical protein